MHELEVEKHELSRDPERIGVLFNEMIQMCLWLERFFLLVMREFRLDSVIQGKCNCWSRNSWTSTNLMTCTQDLSLLTHLSHDDIAHLQTVGREAQEARKKFILKDGQDFVWNHLRTLEGKDARVDFVLDNCKCEHTLLILG